jgi:choline dehydrogenase
MDGSRRVDVIVVGGGAAGAVVAARLSEDPARSVCLVEAGPDYGALSEGGWPADLLDCHQLPASHDWGYDDGRAWSARVLGGCSTHNACLLTWGADHDYDEWGNGWSATAITPYRKRAESVMGGHVRATSGAWHDLVLEGAVQAGFVLLDDVNATLPPTGVGLVPVNERDGVRWNAAFAYLDPARDRPNLAIIDRATADRVVFDGHRACGVVVVCDDEATTFHADRVVLTAGAYGTPAILLRSGIGDPAELSRLGIKPRIDLTGVGANLTNHWTTRVAVEPGPELAAAIHADATSGGVHAVGTIAKAASSLCEDGVWDLHLFTICWRLPDGEHVLRLNASVLRPESRGRVTLASPDPNVAPLIDHNALSDPAGHDLCVLRDGLQRAIAILDTPAVRASGARVTAPRERSDDALATYAAETLGCYYHPTGTCAIGTVVDGSGAIRGTEGLYAADASIIPTIPRANTHLTVLAIAERLARSL